MAYAPLTLERLKDAIGGGVSSEQLQKAWAWSRPCLTLVREVIGGGRAATDDCRLGGSPALPANLEWPADPKGGQLVFICQINLSRLPDGEARKLLPQNGMLYFFVSKRCLFDGELEYEGSWAILYSQDVDAGRGQNMTAGPILEAQPCKLHPVDDMSIPFPATVSWGAMVGAEDEEEVDYLFENFFRSRETFASQYAGVAISESVPVHQMLGYIYAPQGPEVEDGHQCLLQINSDAYTGLNFLDGGTITFIISDDDLKTCNWSNAAMWMYTS